MKPRKLMVPVLLAASLAAAFPLLSLPAPAFAQQDEAEEERLPDEAEDEFAVLEGLKDADTPMTFKFKDQPLREIFDVMGDIVGISITYGDDFPFDKKASVNLPNTTFPAALRSLARTHHLQYKIEEGGGLFVDARE